MKNYVPMLVHVYQENKNNLVKMDMPFSVVSDSNVLLTSYIIHHVVWLQRILLQTPTQVALF